MGLTIWNLLSDLFSHVQLENDFLAIDSHDHTNGHGVQIPTGGIQDGAITTVKLADRSVTGPKLDIPLVLDIPLGVLTDIFQFVRSSDEEEFAALQVKDEESGSPRRSIEILAEVPGGGASDAVDTFSRASANASDGFGAASGHIKSGLKEGRVYAQDASGAHFAEVNAQVSNADFASTHAFAGSQAALILDEDGNSSFLSSGAGAVTGTDIAERTITWDKYASLYDFIYASADQAIQPFQFVNTNGVINITLPTSAAAGNGALVGIRCGTGEVGVDVGVGSDTIYGPAFSTTTLFMGAAGAFVVLVSDGGGNWYVVGGQADTGWAGVALAGGITAPPGGHPLEVRFMGSRVYFRGSLYATGGMGAGATWATVPPSVHPPITYHYPGGEVADTGLGIYVPKPWVLNTSGQVSFDDAVPATSFITATGLSYALDA